MSELDIGDRSSELLMVRSPKEDTEAARRRREEEESIELARQLMEEEAIASYHNSWTLLRDQQDQLSQEDFEALQTAIAEDEREEVREYEDDEGELSYDAMLRLGERIGDVKSERWALEADKHIEKLQIFKFDPSAEICDDADERCLICQCEYEEGEELCQLPCQHKFHADCVKTWLKSKDVCPYCRVAIRSHEVDT